MMLMCPACEKDISQSSVNGYSISLGFQSHSLPCVGRQRKSLNFQVYKCRKWDILTKIVVSIYVH